MDISMLVLGSTSIGCGIMELLFIKYGKIKEFKATISSIALIVIGVICYLIQGV